LWIIPLPKDFLFGEAIVPFENSPRMHSGDYPQGPPRISLFSGFLYWAKRMKNQDIISLQQDPRILMQTMLCLVCAEWLTVINYVSTRLSQIEWELANPEFCQPVKRLGATLEKLHPWRQRIPSFKKIASGSLESVFAASRTHSALLEDHLLAHRGDFRGICTEFQELQTRTETIVTVATAMIGIEESQRAMDQNRNFARLTYLAVVFVPLQFVTGFFSMTPDLEQLKTMFWVYFVVAIPLTILALGLVRFSFKFRGGSSYVSRVE
jgi:Mg2+ and Co2+ transporter CorA